VVGPDDPDSDDFLDDLEEEHEGVFDLGLWEDLGSLLRHARGVRSGLHSMLGLSLRMKLCLHDLLIF